MPICSSSILFFCRLSFVSTKARDKFIEFVTAVSRDSHEIEPGVTKYIACVPREKDNQKTAVMIEEYADVKAKNDHALLPSVQNLVSFLQSKPTPLSGPPTVILSSPIIPGFTKEAVTSVSDPYIIYAQITYHSPSILAREMPNWRAMVKSSESESETHIYNVTQPVDERGLARPSEGSKVVVFESYATPAAVFDVHAQSAAMERLVESEKKKVELTMLRKVAGYMCKSGAGSDQKATL